jgi:hypothetical protein
MSSSAVSSRVERIGLFFRLLILDSTVARQAAVDASAVFLERWRHLDGDSVEIETLEQMDEDLVSISRDQLLLARRKIPSGSTFQIDWSGLKGSESLDPRTWARFVSEASDEEALSLVWSQVLKISDAAIAKSLACSTGTVLFRVGKAVKHLGLLVGA